MVELPEVLNRHWALRGYYGTVNHNVKATYVKYLGWFDGNPANLHPLPPRGSAKYVEFMGGADAVLAKAREAFDAGEYRWVAEVVNHVVFADPRTPGGAGAAGRRARAARLPVGGGHLAKPLPDRRQELRDGILDIPFELRRAGLGEGDDARAALQLPRGETERAKAGGQEDHPELGLHRHRREGALLLVNGSLNHSLDRTPRSPTRRSRSPAPRSTAPARRDDAGRRGRRRRDHGRARPRAARYCSSCSTNSRSGSTSSSHKHGPVPWEPEDRVNKAEDMRGRSIQGDRLDVELALLACESHSGPPSCNP